MTTLRTGLNLPPIPTLAETKSFLSDTGLDSTFDDDGQIERAMSTASGISSATQDAFFYLVAHLLVLERAEGGTADPAPDGGSGEITSESAGRRSASYQMQARDASDVFFSTTYWGRTFLQLNRRAPVNNMPSVFG